MECGIRSNQRHRTPGPTPAPKQGKKASNGAGRTHYAHARTPAIGKPLQCVMCMPTPVLFLQVTALPKTGESWTGVAALQAPAHRSTHALALRHSPRSRLAHLTRSGIPEAHEGLPLHNPLPYFPRTRTPAPMLIARPQAPSLNNRRPTPSPIDHLGAIGKTRVVVLRSSGAGGGHRAPGSLFDFFQAPDTPSRLMSSGSLSVLVKQHGGS